MKTIILIGAMLLSGCANTGFLTNRISCTVGEPEAMINSMYGPIGLTSKVNEVDSKAICKKP